MLCPSCTHELPPGAEVCPVCGANVAHLSTPTPEDVSWCPACGSVVSRDASECPYCGLPLFGQSDPLNPATAEARDPSERDTRLLPRMSSMLTQQMEAPEADPGKPTATRMLALAATAALCVVAATVLVLAHPWNPNLYDTRAQSPADTSMEGFPGTVDKLTGQDGVSEESDAEPQKTADEATYEQLFADLESLDAANEELTRQMGLLEGAASASDESREAWAADAESLSISISNLIEDIRATDVSTGTYADAQDELETMGNYLRNRADALTGAWDAILAPLSRAESQEEAVDAAEAENCSYAGLYRNARAAFQLAEPDARRSP